MKYCEWCLNNKLNKNAKKYCSQYCKIKGQYCNDFLKWYVEGYKDFSNDRLRQFLETIYGHKCSNCKITEWNNKPIVFDVEHKDGFSNNNTPDNICLLCQNCHSQTQTYSNNKTGTGRFTLKNKGLIKND